MKKHTTKIINMMVIMEIMDIMELKEKTLLITQWTTEIKDTEAPKTCLMTITSRNRWKSGKEKFISS